MKLNSQTKRGLLFLMVLGSTIILIVDNDIQSYFLNMIKNGLDYEGTYYIVMACSLIIGLFYSFYFAKNKQPKDLNFL